MKYFIIAGERSGDLHGSNLVKAIQNADNQAIIKGWGGDLMQVAGTVLLKHYKELAFMGFLEVLKNLPKIIGFLKECKQEINQFKPDAVILIDYAGFNMRLAKWAKAEGYQVFYYISPKVWAWNQQRALKLKATVDKLFVIFPFEVDFFKKYNYEVEYVGNPLLDSIQQFSRNPNFIQDNFPEKFDRKIVALLPGSRKQEVEKMLSIMCLMSKHFPQYQFVVAGVDNLSKSFYEKFISENISVVYNQTYDLLSHAQAALVTSGTATLETALLNVPQVVCYKSSWISYKIAQFLIKVKFISLVNLIADKEVVRELIQDQLNEVELLNELTLLLKNDSYRNKILADYQQIKTILNKPNASANVGRSIVQYLQNNKNQLRVL